VASEQFRKHFSGFKELAFSLGYIPIASIHNLPSTSMTTFV
jgi:hypothetical protein